MTKQREKSQFDEFGEIEKTAYGVKCVCGTTCSIKAKPSKGALAAFECPKCGERHMGTLPDGRKVDNRTKHIDEEIIRALVAISVPIGVRSIAYRLEALGIIHKTEADFERVGNRLVVLRREGRVPYSWLADDHRSTYLLERYKSPLHALAEMQLRYRRDIWQDKPYRVEVWLEKAGLSDVVRPICSQYGVPLFLCRGFSSISFVYQNAQEIIASGVSTHILHLGDLDKAGLDASNSLRKEFQRHARGLCEFERVMLHDRQIDEWSLPTRPPKPRDEAVGMTRCAELDAITATQDGVNLMRRQLAAALSVYVSTNDLRVHRVAEAAEREGMSRWAEILGQAPNFSSAEVQPL